MLFKENIGTLKREYKTFNNLRMVKKNKLSIPRVSAAPKGCICCV